MSEKEARQRAEIALGWHKTAEAIIDDFAAALLRADREATERALTIVREFHRDCVETGDLADLARWVLDDVAFAIRRGAGGG